MGLGTCPSQHGFKQSHSILRWSTAPDSDTICLDGLWHTSAAGRTRVFTSSTIRLPDSWGWWSYRILSSTQPSITTLCQIAQSRTLTYLPMLTNSRCRPNSAPSIVEAEAMWWTYFAIPWWGGQMVSNWSLPHPPPEIQHDPVHLRYPPALASPTIADQRRGSPLNRTPKIMGNKLGTHFTFDPHVCECV